MVKETLFKKYHYTGKHAYENDNKPPRIIFGMKVKTFLVVAVVMVLVVVGAAVGGAVGGKNMHQGPAPDSSYGSMPGYRPCVSNIVLHSLTHSTAHRVLQQQREDHIQRTRQRQQQPHIPHRRQHTSHCPTVRRQTIQFTLRNTQVDLKAPWLTAQALDSSNTATYKALSRHSTQCK